MQRLQQLLSNIAQNLSSAQKIDEILETMSAIEAAIPTPNISRAQAEHQLHRLMQ